MDKLIVGNDIYYMYVYMLLSGYPDKIPPGKNPPEKISLNAVEREPVETRVLNPNASEASYKPKQRGYKKTKLKKIFISIFFRGDFVGGILSWNLLSVVLLIKVQEVHCVSEAKFLLNPLGQWRLPDQLPGLQFPEREGVVRAQDDAVLPYHIDQQFEGLLIVHQRVAPELAQLRAWRHLGLLGTKVRPNIVAMFHSSHGVGETAATVRETDA